VKRKTIFWVAVVLQVLILLSLAGRHEYTLRTGQSVLLETTPVDPWEVFRGQYVRLSYKISELSEDDVALTGMPYKSRQPVWVTLEKGPDDYWLATGVSDVKPSAVAGGVLVLARVEWVMDGSMKLDGTGRKVFLHYGIEQFYVPEGQGSSIERNRAGLAVEARVDAFGRAAISRVLLDGNEINWK
jgi:uncharacterized membrane-anchored protein